MLRRGPRILPCAVDNPCDLLTFTDTRRRWTSSRRVRQRSADPLRTQTLRGTNHELTERKIETRASEPGRKDRLVFDDAQRGLAVRVTASGGRTYLCQYTMHGHKWRVPLGACSAVSLYRAREAAAAIMGDVAKGLNPAAERKDAAAAERARRVRDRLTLRVLIDDWNRLHLAERRPSYAAEAVRALHYAFAATWMTPRRIWIARPSSAPLTR